MTRALADCLGATIMTATIIGCALPPPPGDLQPFVAVAGQYSLSGKAAPVAPTGVCSNCGTKVPPGGGFVGDGRVKVPCPECNEDAKASGCQCGCGGKGYIVKADGSRWSCKCPADCSCKGGTKCQDGKCDSPTRPIGR